MTQYNTGRGGGQDRGDPVHHREGRRSGQGDPVQGGEEVRTGVTQYREGRRSGQR